MGTSTEKIISKNPATLETLGEVETYSLTKVAELAKKAQLAFPAWARLSYRERGTYLLKARQYILDHLDEIAQVISQNCGKPLVEVLSADLFPICDLISYYAKNTERLLKPESISLGVTNLLGRRSKVYYFPLGVIGIISPWNFPFSIPMSEVVMALMVGNCVMLKPADAAALVGIKIEEIFKAAGLPSGVFTHLPGGADTGQALLDASINKMIFTGSVRVGKMVMAKCAERLIPCTLELGGKDPMIVCADAHLENAARGAVWGAFSNSGQICASVERVYVDEKIADEFTRRVVEHTKKLKQGVGTDPENEIGPLTTENQLRIVEEQVEDAKKRGAMILTGGMRPSLLGGYFYEPTVLTGVDHSFRCMKEETFGPLLPIMKFKSESEAIALANDSIYGLSASVWTKDLKRGKDLAKKIHAGTVSVNECTYSYAISQTPWGGVKNSGFGRTHGKLGLMELVHVQHIHENFLPQLRDFWWFGYDKKLYETFKYLCKNLTGNLWEKTKGVFRILNETMRKKS